MENQTPESKRSKCVESCDKEFIKCVESWRQDCLDRFGNCSSTCKL